VFFSRKTVAQERFVILPGRFRPSLYAFVAEPVEASVQCRFVSFREVFETHGAPFSRRRFRRRHRLIAIVVVVVVVECFWPFGGGGGGFGVR
jgi:hypothetical protein